MHCFVSYSSYSPLLNILHKFYLKHEQPVGLSKIITFLLVTLLNLQAPLCKKTWYLDMEEFHPLL